MAVSGTLDINLTPYGAMVNNTANFGSGVTQGIADQGALVGQVWGAVIAIGSILGLIGLAFLLLSHVANKAKGVGNSVKVFGK